MALFFTGWGIHAPDHRIQLALYLLFRNIPEHFRIVRGVGINR